MMKRLTRFWEIVGWKKERTQITFKRALRQNPVTDSIKAHTYKIDVSPWMLISLPCILAHSSFSQY